MLPLRFIILTFSILFLCGCTMQKQEEVIMKYVDENFKNMDKSKENCVFIISENGCLHCNREMSYIACKYLDNDNIFVIVNANAGGRIVDISPYWDKHEFLSSYAVFIVNNKVDTILDADVYRLLGNKNYIKKRLTVE